VIIQIFQDQLALHQDQALLVQAQEWDQALDLQDLDQVQVQVQVSNFKLNENLITGSMIEPVIFFTCL
jgi:hypothetical protein